MFYPLKDSRAAAAKARALLLALAKRCLAQQLVPFRLIVERNVEQAAPPVRTGRGASRWQDPNRALMPAAAVTTVLERIEQASLEGGGGQPPMSSLLAERARSEGARSTRAFEDQPGRPLREMERRKAMRKMRSGALLAHRAPTMKQWSLDARSEGQPGHSF
jgi:hypothetical protein